MKKLFALLLVGLFMGGVVFAADTVAPEKAALGISIEPIAVLHSYKDMDNAVGGGLNVNVQNVGIENLRIGGGLEIVSADADVAPGYSISGIPVTATINGKESLDIKDLSAKFAYDVKVNDKLTVAPVLGLHYLFVDADNLVDADNAFGISFGGEASYKVTKDISVFAGLGYQWAETELRYPSISVLGATVGADSQKLSLDNLNATFGVKVQF
jgi:hypothetical protein